jgi:hypothetical protein
MMRTAIGALIFFCIRGLALWALFPMGFVAWLLIAPYRVFSRRRYLGPITVTSWLDLNASAAIARVVLRSLGREFPFTPWSQIEQITHRAKFRDVW